MLPDTLFAFIWHFIRQQKYKFLFLFLTGSVWAVNEALFPYFVKLIVNAVAALPPESLSIFAALKFPLLAMAGMWVLMELSMRSQGVLIVYAFPKLRASIRKEVFEYVKSHSHNYFANNFAGTIADKISDLPTSVQNIVEVMLFNFMSIGLSLIASVFLMWHASHYFAAVMLIWMLVHMTAALLFLRHGNKLAKIHAESVTALGGKVVDAITNITNVRLFARAEFESSYLNRYQTEEINKAHKALWHLEYMKAFQGLATLVFMTTMMYLLIQGWREQWVTLGDFSLITMLSFGSIGLLWYMSYQLTFFVREAGKVAAALRLISVKHEIVDAVDAKPLQIERGEIAFRDLNFQYLEGLPVFKDLNLTIPAGQKIGLVGVSGSGKSTLVNLLLRLYEVNSGSICVDGQSVSEVTAGSLRESIAMIPQEPSLFHRTLLENIRYARLDATDDEVVQAAKDAHCHDFIMQTEEGYQSMVGERGIKLSGGQRQRIAIARAILKDSPILVLDEATSALDSITERLIQESLAKLMRGRTTIVIAHRLSTLADMDRLLVFQQGEIVEDGTMVDLLKIKDGAFRKLWEMQADGFITDQNSTL